MAEHDPAPSAPDAAASEPDLAALTAPGADPAQRNEALRRLFFSDPHFAQSDGLDVPVDEVCDLAQSPQARQRTIVTARALGLLDDDLLEQDPPDADGA